jgi:hypothetical protein
MIFRTFVFSPALISLTLLCAMTTNCGSSGGGNDGPFNVVGDWQANFSANVGATATGYGAINSSGLAAFFDGSGNIVELPTVTGASAFSGNLTAYAVNPTFFPNGSAVVTDTTQGKVNSATSITGAFTGSGTASGTFSVAPDSPLSGSVVPVLGVMNGKIIGFSDTLRLTFSSNGSFTGGDFAGPGSTCNVNGTLTQEGTNNVFDITYAGVSGDCTPFTLTGIAFESKTDYFNVNGGVDATYLYAIMLTSTVANVRPSVIVLYQ